MAVTFDDLLLDTSYSADAEGGPEFSTAIVRSGEGGAVSYVSKNRQDFVSKYKIQFGLLMPDRRRALYDFSVLREGMARGFRFLAPDDRELSGETVGVLNEATGEIELLTETDGATETFFICRNFEDAFNSYLRWITHPAPTEDLLIEIFDAGDTETPVASETLEGFVSDYMVVSREFSMGEFGSVQIAYPYGIIRFEDAPAEGHVIKVTGIYHRPVRFASDLPRFKVDDGDYSELAVELEEILPVELGLNPADMIDIEIPTAPDVTPPTVPGSFSFTGGSGNATADWDASEDEESGVDHYVLEVRIDD